MSWGGGSKQLKIPPGVGLEGGGGPGNLETPLATPLSYLHEHLHLSAIHLTLQNRTICQVPHVIHHNR